MAPSAVRQRAPLAAVALLVVALVTAKACVSLREEEPEQGGARGGRSAVVTATAYTSHPEQTDGDPFLTASGARLDPGDRALAVSPDLLADGLEFGTRVRIEGIDGEWVVRDRMPDDRRRAVDLYYGLDEAAAERFGKRRVTIRWQPEAGDGSGP